MYFKMQPVSRNHSLCGDLTYSQRLRRSLGSWTVGCISCRHSASTSFLSFPSSALP